MLGLTDLKATIDSLVRELQSITDKDTQARAEMNSLEERVSHTQSQLLKLRQREGQLWLIPDKTITTKEPILVTVAGTGITIERFDRPDQSRRADANDAGRAFASYLSKAKNTDQYVVFLIKPSGVTLFQSLVQSARDVGFDVGYDALEENRQVHFSTPPPIDEPEVATNEPGATVSLTPPNSNSTDAASPPKSTHSSQTCPAATTQPKNKGGAKIGRMDGA